MAIFEKAFEFMIANEVDAKNVNKITSDTGGVTKYGISTRFLKNAQLADADFNHDGKLDEQDVIVMTLDEAHDLYEKYFWQPIHGDDLDDQVVANKLLDMAVNMGEPSAVRLLQQSVNAVFRTNLLKDDAVFGKLTLDAVNKADPTALVKMLREFSAHYYLSITNARPVSSDEMHSWLRRAALC